jgi:hypothetical protein
MSFISNSNFYDVWNDHKKTQDDQQKPITKKTVFNPVFIFSRKYKNIGIRF